MHGAIRMGTPTAHPDGGADQDQVRQLEDQVHGLSHALHSRDVIGQAKGALIAHLEIGPDAAFALLVRCSQHANTTLAELAAVLVDRVYEPGPADPSHCPSQHTVIDEPLTESRTSLLSAHGPAPGPNRPHRVGCDARHTE